MHSPRETADEQVGQQQARGDVLLETMGTTHPESRVALHSLLPRLEYESCYHAKQEEMSLLQEGESNSKRTLPL
jgi:hypothetical protein